MRNAASRKQNSGPSCCSTPSTRKQTDADVTSPNQAFSSLLLMLTLLQLPRRQGDTTLRHPACKLPNHMHCNKMKNAQDLGWCVQSFLAAPQGTPSLWFLCWKKKAGLNWPATYVVPIGHGVEECNLRGAICNQVARTCRTAACLLAACPNLVFRHEQVLQSYVLAAKADPSFKKVRNPTIFDPRPAVAFTTSIACRVTTLNALVTTCSD